MAKVRTISRGVPITPEVLNEHSEAINSLYNEVFSRSNGVTIKRDSVSPITVNPLASQIWAEQVSVLSSSKVVAGQTYPWSITFSPAFTSTPVVTASAIIPDSSRSPAQKAQVKITSISSSTVQGIIICPEDGSDVTVSVSVIAVGQPTT